MNEVLVFDSDTARVCTNIPIMDDSVVELTEMFGVMLTTSEPDVDLQDTSAIVDIIDNDRAVIGFEMEQYQGEEGEMVEVCAVLMNGTLERSLIIELFTGDISAQGTRKLNVVYYIILRTIPPSLQILWTILLSLLSLPSTQTTAEDVYPLG